MRQLFIAGDWLFIAIGVGAMAWSTTRMVAARSLGRRDSGTFMVGMGIVISSIASLHGLQGAVGWPHNVERLGMLTTVSGAIIAWLGRRAEAKGRPDAPGA